jgi:uncharacterized membrane protein YagU involved in acid resistance
MMNTLQRGIWSGFLATGPMTLMMFELQKNLPPKEKSPLPPASLTNHFLQFLKLDNKVTSHQRAHLTMLSHFSYGAASGALYALLTNKWKAKPWVKGSGFGLGVWALSYLAWIPSLHLRPSAFRMPMKRNLLMIASHLVWGACLGFAENELRRSGLEMLDGQRKAVAAE